MIRPCSALLLALALVLVPAMLHAQDYPAPRSVEVGGSVGWMGGTPGGSATALETRNRVGGLPRLTLFAVDGRLESTTSVAARVAFNLTRTVALEAGLSYGRPVLAARVSADFEGSPDLTVRALPLRQYVIEGGVAVHLRGLRIRGGGLPFVAAAAGYLRELSDERAAVETGRAYRLGAGVKQPLGHWGGLRFDAGLGVRDGGFSLDEPRVRAFFTASAGVFAVF